MLLHVYSLLLHFYSVLDSPPKLKHLYNLVTPDYAAHWRIIGTLLDISKGRLDAIERTFPANATWCCNRMLETWLEIDIGVSWRTLIEVIDSPAVMAACNASTIVQVVMPTETNAGNYCASILYIGIVHERKYL